MSAKDYYKILGVDEKADSGQIKASYRKLAKKYHPDTNAGNKQAEERFKEISEAYDVIGNAEKRQKYDQMKRFGGTGNHGMNFSGFDFGGFSGARQGFNRSPGSNFSFNGSSMFGNLGGIFSQILNMGQPGCSRQQRQPPRGVDIKVNLAISFELSITGGKTSFSVKKEKVCPECGGGGAKPGSTVESCRQCGGKGVVMANQGGFGVSQPCPACKGKGQIVKNPCLECNGSGVALGKRTYSVRIPPGIESGKQIRLKGEGQPASGNIPAGDMLINVSVKQHRFFKRRGKNIICEVKLGLKEVITDSKVKVKTVHGKKVILNIPAGTADGSILRITGMGIQAAGKNGDQLVTVNIKIPSNPSDKEKQLLREYENLTAAKTAK